MMKRILNVLLSLGITSSVWAGLALTGNHWTPGATIQIALEGGNEIERQCVRLLVDEVEKIVNLRFHLAPKPDFSWNRQPHVEMRLHPHRPSLGGSLEGTSDTGNVFLRREKMDFYLRPEISASGAFDEEACRTHAQRPVLHEFGHLLGLKHEHQHPDVPSAVTGVMSAFYPNSDQILPLRNTRRLTVTPYDPASLMHYPFFMRGDVAESLANDQRFAGFLRPSDSVGGYEFLALVDENWKPLYGDFRTNRFSAGDVALLQSIYGAPAD